MINVSHFENKRLFCLGIYQAALTLWQHFIPMTLSQADHMENSEITFCVCVYVGRVICLRTIFSLANKKKRGRWHREMKINSVPLLVLSQEYY